MKKPEAPDVQGTCVKCLVNKQTLRSRGSYRSVCQSCHFRTMKKKSGKVRDKYKHHKRDACEKCGFVPSHPCQLDVDHIDGNRTNSDPSNLMTLCANCHRIKTYLNEDWRAPLALPALFQKATP